MDGELADFIRELQSAKKTLPQDLDKDVLEVLKNNRFITENDEDDFLMYKSVIQTQRNSKGGAVFTIAPTMDCCFSCHYCFEKCKRPSYMDENVMKGITKYIASQTQTNYVGVTWFGGEPLMYFDEVVEPISTFAKNLCSKYDIPFFNHATTNAYFNTDDMISKFKDIQLNSFQIPIDGNEKKHNSVKYMGKHGHLKQILRSINLIAEQIENSHIILRINYDKDTLDSVSEIIPFIAVKNRNKIMVDFQRVWQVEKNTSSDGNNYKLLSVKKCFEEAGFFTTYFAYSFKQYSCCYADSFYHWVINYDGNVFKCSARDYSPSLVAATIGDNGQLVFNPIVYDYFSDYTFDNEQCLKCKRLPLCYGPCVQKRYETLKQHKEFHCLHESAEISLEQYIQQLYEKKS